jgi:serine/threonine protein kinase
MSQPPLIRALAEASRKRRILSSGAAGRLADAAGAAGISSAQEARAWLGSGASVSLALGERLLPLLPSPSQDAIGPYAPLARLAEGGMGAVWLCAGAHHAGAHELVVVKTIRDRSAGQSQRERAEYLKRFARESRITQSLAHENVVRCLDHGEAANGELFLALEYVAAGDLRDLVEAYGCLPEALALALVAQVADGLGEAHRLQLVHRDIKPRNIFVTADGVAKLADFGVARSTALTRTVLTEEGAIVGSPHYMSPEQVLGDTELDIRSDIYALGGVLYACLSGRTPYAGTIQEVLRQHVSAEPPDLRLLRTDVAPATMAIIATAMAKRRGERFADPGALRSAIIARLGGEPAAAAAAAWAGASQRLAARLLASLASGQDDTDCTTPPHLRALGDERPMARADAGATTATLVAQEELARDASMALRAPWIALLPREAADPTLVVLVARLRVVLGKLREPPVDLCMRDYPVDEHRDVLTRISRTHVALRYDVARDGCVLEELNAVNGSVLDGMAVPPGATIPLTTEEPASLTLADSVHLRLAPARRRSPACTIASLPAAPGEAAPDLAHAFGVDAVAITRPRNRPELAYAMVLRRVTIGGTGSMLTLPNARAGEAVEIGRAGGAWLWRAARTREPWQPLEEGTELDCGGVRLRAEPGSYQQFT